MLMDFLKELQSSSLKSPHDVAPISSDNLNHANLRTDPIESSTVSVILCPSSFVPSLLAILKSSFEGIVLPS